MCLEYSSLFGALVDPINNWSLMKTPVLIDSSLHITHGASLCFMMLHDASSGLQIRCVFLFLKCPFLHQILCLTTSQNRLIETILTSGQTQDLVNPMFDHQLESSHRDDSNQWSNIGFGEGITQVESIEVYLTLNSWSSVNEQHSLLYIP